MLASLLRAGLIWVSVRRCGSWRCLVAEFVEFAFGQVMIALFAVVAAMAAMVTAR